MLSTRLLPKEEKYFQDFKEMISHVHEVGKLTNELFSSDVPDKNLLLKIKPHQLRADEVLSRVVKRLNKTFITPFDREDIFALVKRLDRITDELVSAASRVDTFDVKKKIKYADQLSAVILQQLEELDTAIQDLKIKRANEMKAVKDLELEADRIYQLAMKELFATETNPIELIKEKEILEHLENASDRCQSAANVIMSTFIKNS